METSTGLAVKISKGKFGKIPAAENDIGGQLLPILSKGLYTNPLDCIREYVQNSVDAGARTVTIKLTGNSVIIHDNGDGMNEEQLLASRKFGVSAKDVSQSVGFRGIGIYSGYDLGSRLVITTKQKGETVRLVMRFDFAAMKRELERSSAGTVSLSRLLSEHTAFKAEEDDTPESSFTIVQLEDINEVHLRKLANRADLRRYILQNLPVDFDKQFPHRDVIDKQLRENVQGYKAVVIALESDDAADEVVAKPPILHLRPPKYGAIKNKRDEVIGYYWACLNEFTERLGDKNVLKGENVPKPDEYQGFVYKCKGFSVGDRNKLARMFTAGSGTLYQWYTGEIYVIDPAVIPNTERDDFETSSAKTAFEVEVKRTLTSLQDDAVKFQQQGNADRRVEKALADLESLEAEIRRAGIDSLDDFSQLVEIQDTLKKHRTKATAALKDRAEVAQKRVERLQKDIRSNVERSSGSSRRKTPKTARPARSEKPTSETEPRTLTDVVGALEVCETDRCRKIVATIDAALSAIVGAESSLYARIVDAVEGALQAEVAE